MRHVPTVLRVVLGLAFLVFGLNYFLGFLPAQPPPPPEAGAFLGGFAGAKFFELIKVIEIGAGVLLLTNRFVPLALALLAPILVGIVWFHAMLAPAGTGLVVGLLAIEIALAYYYRAAFAPMLRARTAPTGLPLTAPAPQPLRA